MRFKYLILILVLSLFENLYSQENLIKQKQLIDSFFEQMKDIDGLNEFVENSQGYTINFVYVDKFKIFDINKNSAIVDVDTGRGSYCIRVHLDFVYINEKFLLKSYPAKNNFIVNPWNKKEKICR